MLDVPGARVARALQLCVLGSVFVAFGGLVAWFSCPPLQTFVASRHWPTTTAKVQWVIGDTEGGWEPSYAFEVGGKKYAANGADTSHEYPAELFRRLSAAKESGAAITVVYDPQNPKHAYVERKLTVHGARKAFFGLPFASAGFVALLAAFALLAAGLARALRRMLNPSRPWRWETAFRNGRVLDSNRLWSPIAFFAALAIITFVGGTLGGVALSRDDDESSWDLLIPAAVFGLVSLALLGYSLRSFAQRQRGGVPMLLLPQVPLLPGTSVRAVARWNGEVAGVLTASLIGEKIAVHEFWARSSTPGPGERSFRRKQREVRAEGDFERSFEIDPIHVRQDGEATVIDLDLSLPSDRPDRQTENLPGYRWRLELRRGEEVLADFQLPVFRAEPDAIETFELAV